MDSIIITPAGSINSYIISSNDGMIFRALSTLYGLSHTVAGNGGGCFFHHISAQKQDDSYLISFRENTFKTDLPLQAIENILFDTMEFGNSVFPLHGGAVEVGGKAYLFPAQTGTGKTTLISYLTQKGYSYINDDTVLIDMNTFSTVPAAAPIHLRPESIPVLEKYGCTVRGAEVAEGIDRIVYMPERVADDALPIAGIFFISRSENGNFCEAVPKAQAVQLLMSALLSPNAHDAARLRCAIRLCEKCRRLVYSDMEFVRNLLAKEQEL